MGPRKYFQHFKPSLDEILFPFSTTVGRTAWNNLSISPDVPGVFLAVMDTPGTLTNTPMKTIERWEICCCRWWWQRFVEYKHIYPYCNSMLIALHAWTHQCSSKSGWGQTETLCSTKNVARKHPNNSSLEAKSPTGSLPCWVHMHDEQIS